MAKNSTIDLIHTLGHIALAIGPDHDYVDPDLRPKHLNAMAASLADKYAAVAAAAKAKQDASRQLRAETQAARSALRRVRAGVEMHFGEQSLEYAAVGGKPRRPHRSTKHAKNGPEASVPSPVSSPPVPVPAAPTGSAGAQRVSVPLDVTVAPATNGASPTNGAAH